MLTISHTHRISVLFFWKNKCLSATSCSYSTTCAWNHLFNKYSYTCSCTTQQSRNFSSLSLLFYVFIKPSIMSTKLRVAGPRSKIQPLLNIPQSDYPQAKQAQSSIVYQMEQLDKVIYIIREISLRFFYQINTHHQGKTTESATGIEESHRSQRRHATASPISNAARRLVAELREVGSVRISTFPITSFCGSFVG